LFHHSTLNMGGDYWRGGMHPLKRGEGLWEPKELLRSTIPQSRSRTSQGGRRPGARCHPASMSEAYSKSGALGGGRHLGQQDLGSKDSIGRGKPPSTPRRSLRADDRPITVGESGSETGGDTRPPPTCQEAHNPLCRFHECLSPVSCKVDRWILCWVMSLGHHGNARLCHCQ